MLAGYLLMVKSISDNEEFNPQILKEHYGKN